MPQNFFEPRTPVARVPRPQMTPGLETEPGSLRNRPDPEAPDEGTRPIPASRRDEPSWARIYWNTLRSYTRRRLGMRPRVPGGGDRPGAHRIGLFIAVALVAVVGTAATVTWVIAEDTPKSPAPHTAPSPRIAEAGGSSQARDDAVQWVTAYVGSGHVVACDAPVCGALGRRGFPATSLVRVGSSARELQSADVVVITATLRTRLGAGLSELTAGQPLVSFGDGSHAVAVSAVAHSGRDAYDRIAATDLTDRRFAGTSLLANKSLTFPPAARDLLAVGRVDMRICALLATLSADYALTVESFGPVTPGTGGAAALSSVNISTADGEPATGDTASARAVRAVIRAQQAPFEPLSSGTQHDATGREALLNVLYAQPAPSGLGQTNTP